MKHWAAPLIGKPWAPNATGPDAFDCWGLVRHVFVVRHGIDMPEVAVGGEDNVQAICAAAHVSGWRPVTDGPQADDIVLMRGLRGRHVGVMVQASARLRLLHAAGHMSGLGPVGCVVAQSINEAIADGYHHHEFWRRKT